MGDGDLVLKFSSHFFLGPSCLEVKNVFTGGGTGARAHGGATFGKRTHC